MPFGWAAAAAAIVGSSMQADAAGNAAHSQGAATDRATEEQRRQYDQARQDSAPFRDTGVAANSRMRDLLGLQLPAGSESAFDGNAYLAANPDVAANPYFAANPYQHYQQYGKSEMAAGTRAQFQQPQQQGSPSGDFGSLTKKFTVNDFWNDPVTQLGYQFGMDEGTKGLNRMAAARGSLNSGATLKDLTKFGTDYTGSKANDSLLRFQNQQDRTYNQLAGVSGSGQVAQQNTSALGAQTATNVGNLLSAQGNARGAASIAQGNAYGNGFNTVGSMWNQQNLVNQLRNNGQQTPYFQYTGYDGSSSGPAYG